MLGFKYIKSQPTVYLMQIENGAIKRQGAGQSFFYYRPSSTIVAVPIGAQSSDFIIEVGTADYQSVTVQGEVSYRVADPQKIAQMMDFSLSANGKDYVSQDPSLLGSRLIMQAEVLINQSLQQKSLQEAIRSAGDLAQLLQDQLQQRREIEALGLEILGVSIVAVLPTPDIASALEARAREEHLKAADDAIYSRRMAAVQNERAIRQNELDTEIAVEEKKNEIQKTQMKAKASRIRQENELLQENMQADIALEKERKAFIASKSANMRTLAEAQAYKVAALVDALDKADPRTVQALAAVGMRPEQLIAQAFGGIAEKAEKIGQLNMSPDLLNTLMGAGQQAQQVVHQQAAPQAQQQANRR